MSSRRCILGLLAVLCCLALPGCGDGGGEVPNQANVLLITVDTLRADHLSAYGYARNTSPSIDALAETGFRFTDAMVQWPSTWPSTATLLSGTYPRTHGVGVKRAPIPLQLPVLSEIFAAGGYLTAAVVSNFNLGRTWAFDRGFDHFVESWQEKWEEESPGGEFQNRPGRVKHYTNATLVTDQGLRWLDQRPQDQPFFLWLHYMDPHGPYYPPAEYADTFTSAPPPGSKGGLIEASRIPGYQRQLAPDGEIILDPDFYVDQYDRELRYLNDQIARLVAGLESRKLRSNTIIAFTADHGESLGEHAYYFHHGKFSYQANAHVPLFFVIPDSVLSRVLAGDRKSGVIDQPVGLIDVPATLVELAGLQAPPTFEGTSLVSLMGGDSPKRVPEEIFMESGRHAEATQTTIRQGRYKLIHVRSPEDRRLMRGREFELYDLLQDPNEERDISAERPELTARLAAALEAGYEQKTAPRPSEGLQPSPELDQRAIDMLKELGYLEGETDAPAGGVQ